jgi:transcriptional regulator with PAS, ATPase and Fis domain
MPSVLLAWIGHTDLKAARGDAVGLGPIGQAFVSRTFDYAVLLADCPERDATAFVKWLGAHANTEVHQRRVKLSSPMDFGEIFEAAAKACEFALSREGRDARLTFHLSPGTPAMAAVWILLAKTRFPAELIESSREHGVKTAHVPFDISLEFIPDLLSKQDERLRTASAAEPPVAPEFSDILHRSRVMKRVLERARRVALHNVPVLIEGESGTGKELLARAIHRASPRRNKPFIPVNCGAIPSELIDSELFGHKRGAFTGAVMERAGHFEAASGGTLFLDEIGELPLNAQVRLLRVLQEGSVVRIGSTVATPVDVRIIAATNRSLAAEVAKNSFREDLYFRLAVAVLTLPPLRDRQGDVGYILDQLFAKVSLESSQETRQNPKTLSVGARNILLTHSWPGNVRELLNTIRRLVIWADSPVITVDDARESLLARVQSPGDDSLGQPLGDGFDLQEVLSQTARHYLSRAMTEANGNKRKAAELVGLPSYQTLTNWLKRYEVRS